jgi:hypothetical protein
MPEELKHMADKPPPENWTHALYLEAAGETRNSKITHGKNANGVKAVSTCAALPGMDMIRHHDACFGHHVHNTYKDIFNLIRNKGSMKVTGARLELEMERFGTNLMRTGSNGTTILPWVATNWEHMDDLVRGLRLYMECSNRNRLKRPCSDMSKHKMHDSMVLMGDIGIYYITNLTIKKNQKHAICKLLRAIGMMTQKTQYKASMSVRFQYSVEALTLCEIHLPLVFATCVRHCLLHCFQEDVGYTARFGPVPTTWKYVYELQYL